MEKRKKQPGHTHVKPARPDEPEQRKTPPDLKQIRRELGWDLVRLERGEPHKR